MKRSYKLKLTRAEHHICEAETRFSAWLSKGYRVFEQPNSKGRFELCAEMLEEIPDEIALIIGDAFHSLRDCLDHIVFALAIDNTPALTKQQKRDCQFPIFNRVVNIGDKSISALPIDAQAAIINFLADPTGNQISNHPLWILNKMNNRDKHRAISFAVASSAVNSFALNASDGSDYFHIIGPARPVVGGGPVTFMEFTRSKNVKADISFRTQITFDDGAEISGKEVFSCLRNIHDHIKVKVIKDLELFFN